MSKQISVRDELERFKAITASELDFRKIENFMIRRLNVERLPNKGGSHRFYRHPAIEADCNEFGHFQAALKKRSPKPKIFRQNFLEYLYPVLDHIVNKMDEE